MIADSIVVTDEHLLDHLKDARNSDAVLKHEFVELRGVLPTKRIFVFEGDDDRVIYFSWIMRLSPNVDYEPFCCRGKKRVLRLRDILERDKSGLANGVYFFVDRDFDDLQGRPLGTQTYMTDYYSVENYLVDPIVIDRILSTDLHCHSKPDLRKEICTVFETVCSAFLLESVAANQRIFIARSQNIELVSQLPADCKKIANITLTGIVPSGIPVEDWIVFKEQPTEAQSEASEAVFRTLDPLKRYRGKFLLDFMRRWLSKLIEDYCSETPCLILGINRNSKVRSNEMSIGAFAMKSKLPDGLKEFLDRTVEA